MNTFELHDAATELSDSASAYELAKRIIKRDRYISDLGREVNALESSRVAYSSEFDGDVGSIHENIRAMKAKCNKLEQELLEEQKKSAFLSQLRPHSVTEKELARHDLHVAADALEEQAEAYAKQQTQRISWELQDEADSLREKAENMI